MKSVCILLSLVALTSTTPVSYDQRQDGGINVRADLQNIVLIAVVPKMEGTGSLLLDALSSLPGRKGLKTITRRRQALDSVEQIDDQEKAEDRIVEERFLEPKTPYQVDLSQAKSNLAKLYPTADVSELQVKSAHSPLLKLAPVSESSELNVVPVKDNKYVTGRDVKVVEVVPLDDDIVTQNYDKIPVNDEAIYEGSGDSITRVNRDSGLLLLGAMEQCGPDRYRDAEGVCRSLEKDKL